MIGILYTWVALGLTVVFTIFCIVALMRRYVLCYLNYVNDVTLDTIPDGMVETYDNWDIWWNNSSPNTWLHLIIGWFLLILVAWTWIAAIPILTILIVSGVHRNKIRNRKEFEKQLKGSS